MRRLTPLLPLLLIGCGGTSHSGGIGVEPFFSAKIPALVPQDLIGGFDAAGAPMAIVYDTGTETARILTPKGRHDVSLAGHGVVFGLGIDAGYASYYTDGDGNTVGGLLLDTATGQTWTNDDVRYVAGDGTRMVVDESPGFAIEELRTGVETPLPVPDGRTVWQIVGDVVLTGKDQGPIPGSPPSVDMGLRRKRSGRDADGDNRQHSYAFSLETTAGAPIADLAPPAGKAYAWVQDVNAAGEAVGFAFSDANFDDCLLVRWNRSGTPTVLGPSDGFGDDVGIGSDGRVLVANGDSRVLRIFEGTTGRTVTLNVQLGGAAEFSRDGRTAVIRNEDFTAVRFFRLP